MPSVLSLVLNRFTLDYETFARVKINNIVHFPFVLNFNKFKKPYDQIQEFVYQLPKESEEPAYFNNSNNPPSILISAGKLNLNLKFKLNLEDIKINLK
jgi:hypothetical protein